MINNLGKWFYVTDPVEAEKPETYKMLRVMHVREPYEGKIVCDTELPIRSSASSRDIIGPTVDEDYLLKHYTAISPQLVTYWAVFKDAPAFHSFYIILEPYNLEDKQAIGAAISVYPAMSTLYGITPHIFTCHKRMDAVEYFRDMKGYKEYEAGPFAATYYNDTDATVMALSLYDWTKTAPCQTMFKLLEYRNAFAVHAHVDIDPDVEHSPLTSFDFLKNHLMHMHSELLNIMPITQNGIRTLQRFVQDHDLDNRGCIEILTDLLWFESKTGTITSRDVIHDEVFQRSLIVMPYSMKMDLEKIKSNNPMYTLVLAKTIDHPMDFYVIMYRKAPVEFRSSNQTGFSQDEITKLLR